MGFSRLLPRSGARTQNAVIELEEPEVLPVSELVPDPPEPESTPKAVAAPLALPLPQPARPSVEGTRVIAFANQKGGVAKTTTTLNLGVALSELGHRVLLVDLDPQGNLTMSQGLNPDAIERSMFDVLVHRIPI